METAPRDTTPPLIQASIPTAKEKKYDRQLRLWAASGQRALEDAHVLLVIGGAAGSNSSVAGVETLKNLVLPGIGNFTIADAATVTEADLGVNFFLEADSLSKSRAEETRRLLEELNPDVKGHAISTKLDSWLSGPEAVQTALKPYNLILLCAPFPSHVLDEICTYAQESSIPLIYVHSVGFYSSFSVQLPQSFPIVHTHPDPDSTQDLRLFAPWPELSSEVLKLGNLEEMSDYDHGHVPYILLLLYYLNEWKGTHSDSLPATFKEKTQFRDLVRSGARTDNAEGGEENYDEACAAVLKTLSPPSIGSGCREMFQMPACTEVAADSPNFWIIANAIKAFHEKHAVLPIPGGLPDMKARSADYIALQNIYKRKARADVAEVLSTVRQTSSTVPVSEIESFCKNAAHVRVLEGVPLPHHRLQQPKFAQGLASSALEDQASSTSIFLALLQSDDIESSVKDGLLQLLNVSATTTTPPSEAETEADEEGSEPLNIRRALEEVKRFENGELHNIASLTGGMVAQEAIKLITRQYVPVNNVCIYDGIGSKTEVMRL